MNATFGNHVSFGIDIDLTLIEGPNSVYIQDFIKNNQQHEFHIITFRSGWAFNNIETNLNEHGLSSSLFKSVNGVPKYMSDHHHNIAYPYFEAVKAKRFSKAERILKYNKVSLEDFNERDLENRLWKGKMCAELGCTILFDDLVEFVKPGCDHYNIELVDSINHQFY